MSLTGFFQALFALLSGPLGIAIVSCILVWGILESIGHKRLGPVIWAICGGAAFYAIPWIMTTVMQGNGG